MLIIKIQKTLHINQFLGRKCKIFLNKDYILIGYILSMDNFFNFLVYKSFISKTNEENGSKNDVFKIK